MIQKVNSNIAEVFNSIVAKFVGGTRTNFSARQSYSARCAASVVAFNTKQPQTLLYNIFFYKNPNTFIKRLELKERKLGIKVKSSCRRKPSSCSKQKPKDVDKDYGDFCQKPVLNEVDFQFAKTEHLKYLI